MEGHCEVWSAVKDDTTIAFSNQNDDSKDDNDLSIQASAHNQNNSKKHGEAHLI